MATEVGTTRLDDVAGSSDEPLPFDLAEFVERARNAIQTPAEGPPYVAREGHRAYFDGGRFTFTVLPASPITATDPVTTTQPLTSSASLTTSQELTIELVTMHMGQTSLLPENGPGPAEVDGNALRFGRGQTVVEEFMARDAGVEQRWWIEEDPGLQGDLTVSVEVETALALAQRSDGFVFLTADDADDGGVPVAHLSRALAIDAAGEKQWASLSAIEITTATDGLRRYRLQMTFPADWLQQAQYPLLVDPLVGSLLRGEQDSPAGAQLESAVAYNADDDEYVVVWRDYRNGSDYDIYGQRVSGDGGLLGDNFVISDANNDQLHPQIAYGGGVYLVAWRDKSNDPNRGDAYGRVVSPTGELGGSAFVISADTYTQSPTDIVYNPDLDHFFVVWKDLRTAYWDTWGRHVSTAGNALQAVQITWVGSEHEVNAAVAYNDDAQYLLVWEKGFSSRNIQAQRVIVVNNDPKDFLLPVETLQIATGSADQRAPDVVYLAGADRYVTGWHDDRDSGSNGYDIYGQLVNPNGSLDGNNYVVADASADEKNPTLALDGAGGAVAVWQRDNGGTEGTDLYGRRLGADGLPLTVNWGGPVGHPIVEADGGQFGPAIAPDGNSNYLVVWHDDRNGDKDIYASRLMVSAEEWDAPGAFMIHPAVDDQEWPEIAYNADDDEYLVVWEDYRHGVNDADVYGQRISGEGVLVGENITVTAAAYNQLRPSVAYAPASGRYLVAWTHHLDGAGSNYDAYGAILDGAGAVLTNTLVITTGGGANSQAAPEDVIYNDDSGKFLVLWKDLATGSWNVWGRHVAASGAMDSPVQLSFADAQYEAEAAGAYDPGSERYQIVWTHEASASWDLVGQQLQGSDLLTATQPLIVATGSERRGVASVAHLGGDGPFVVVWHDNRNDSSGSPWDVYGQAVSTGGTLEGSNYVLDSGSDFEIFPAVISDGAGGGLALWDAGAGGSESDLYGRWLDNDGQPAGGTFTVTQAAERQIMSAPAGDGAGRFMIAWQDNRNGGWDIYAQPFQPLQAGFIASPTAGLPPLSVVFTDTSSPAGVADQWQWDFDDGGTSTAQHPVYTYTTAGVYTVTLTVTDTDTAETDTLVAASYVQVESPLQTTVISYEYDALYRLTGADYTGAISATYDYAYDSVGNMTAFTETVTSTRSVERTFDGANQLITSFDDGAGTTSYTYDGNGNLTVVYPPGSDAQNPAGALQYDYDQRNMLITHTTYVSGTGWVLQAAYVYDGANDRLQQVDHTGGSAITTTYTNDVVGLTEVLLADDGANQVYNLFGLDLIQQDGGSEVRTLLADGLGSVRLELANGAVEAATTYSPYGEVLAQSGTSGTVYGFTGEQEDSATGLLYLRARYYSLIYTGCSHQIRLYSALRIHKI